MATTQTTTRALAVPGIGPVDVAIDERGAGHPVLLLHGGAGPQSVAGFADLLAAAGSTRVLAPTHPGFGGTPRLNGLDSIAGLAATYAALLEALDLRAVAVVGNSIGGWIAAELALRAPARLGVVVLFDAVGIEVPGHPAADVFALTPARVAQLSYHDPATFGVAPAALPEAQRAALVGNRAALAVYGGASMAEPYPARPSGQYNRAHLGALGGQRPHRRPRLRPRLRRGDPRRAVPAAASHRPRPPDRDARAAAPRGLGVRRRRDADGAVGHPAPGHVTYRPRGRRCPAGAPGPFQDSHEYE